MVIYSWSYCTNWSLASDHYPVERWAFGPARGPEWSQLGLSSLDFLYWVPFNCPSTLRSWPVCLWRQIPFTAHRQSPNKKDCFKLNVHTETLQSLSLFNSKHISLCGSDGRTTQKDVICQRKNVTFNQKYLSDWHCAEDVEENKRTVSVVFSQQVTMWQPLDVWERDKWELGDHSAIKAEEKQSLAAACLEGTAHSEQMKLLTWS